MHTYTYTYICVSGWVITGLNQVTAIFIQQNAFANVVNKMAAILFWSRYFNLCILAFWSIWNSIFLLRHERTACTTVICLLLMSLVFPYWLYTIVRTFEHGIGHQVQLRTKRFDNFLQLYVLTVNDFVFVFVDVPKQVKKSRVIYRW